jgi:hypothetical protein
MRAWPRLLGLLLFGAFVGLGAAEVLLRVVPWPERRAHVGSDPVRHHRLRAGWQGTVQGHAFEVNALGLRERELEIPATPGTRRIVMLGDSFTEGGGLAAADTVPRRLEALLATRCPGIAVLNAGTASYSPILHYLVMRELGARLRPDLVILNFDLTDVHDDLVRTALAELDTAGLPIRVPNDRRRETAIVLPPVLPAAVRPFEARLSGLALWQALRRSWLGRRMLGELNLDEATLAARGLLGDLHYDRLAITRETPGDGEAAAWELTARYLAGIQRLAAGANARFVVVTYPYAHQVAAHESPEGRLGFGVGAGLYTSERPFRTLEAIGRRYEFPVLTLVEAFRRATTPSRPLFRRDDIHHTPEGARVMSEGIARGLLERELVPGCGASETKPTRGSG